MYSLSVSFWTTPYEVCSCFQGYQKPASNSLQYKMICLKMCIFYLQSHFSKADILCIIKVRIKCSLPQRSFISVTPWGIQRYNQQYSKWCYGTWPLPLEHKKKIVWIVRIPASHKCLEACFILFSLVIVCLVPASKSPQLTFRVASSMPTNFGWPFSCVQQSLRDCLPVLCCWNINTGHKRLVKGYDLFDP